MVTSFPQDASCYETAWELSGHHNSRAQRSLGYLYLRAKEVRYVLSTIRSISPMWYASGTIQSEFFLIGMKSFYM